jgi:rubrerythrin
MNTTQRLAKLEARVIEETEESNAERIARVNHARMMEEYSAFLGTVERILQTVPELYAPLIEATLSELALKPEEKQWQFFYSGAFIGGDYGELARDCDGQGMALLKHALQLASRRHKGARCVPAQTCEILISGAPGVEFGGASMGLWECRECNYFMPQNRQTGARELLLKTCPACGGEPTKDFHELKNYENHRNPTATP